MTILKKLAAVENQANDFGFSWPHAEMILDNISSECQEIREVLEKNGSQAHLQEEIGDLIHAAFCLCLFCGFDGEKTLTQAVNKVEKRLNAVKKIAEEAGHQTVHGLPIDTLMGFWHEAKKRVG
jgi:uncharacterized protein YabN with tetrapyrrole methylase and pyrophosphatase domain